MDKAILVFLFTTMSRNVIILVRIRGVLPMMKICLILMILLIGLGCASEEEIYVENIVNSIFLDFNYDTNWIITNDPIHGMVIEVNVGGCFEFVETIRGTLRGDSSIIISNSAIIEHDSGRNEICGSRVGEAYFYSYARASLIRSNNLSVRVVN